MKERALILFAHGARDPKWAAPFLTGGPVFSSPTVVGGVVYVGSNDGKVYAIDAATGGAKWAAP